MPAPFHEVMLPLEDAVAAYIKAECGFPAGVEVITSAQELGGIDGDPEAERQGLPPNHVLVVVNRAAPAFPEADARDGISNKLASVVVKINTESAQEVTVAGRRYKGRNFSGLVAGTVLDALHRTDLVDMLNQHADGINVDRCDTPSEERDAVGQSFMYLISFECAINPVREGD